MLVAALGTISPPEEFSDTFSDAKWLRTAQLIQSSRTALAAIDRAKLSEGAGLEYDVLGFDRAIERYREGRTAGLVMGAPAVRAMIEQVDDVLALPPAESPFARPLREFPAGFDEATRRDFEARYLAAIEHDVLPARAGKHREPARLGRIALPLPILERRVRGWITEERDRLAARPSPSPSAERARN